MAAEPPTTFGIGDALVAVGDADQLHPYRYARRSGGFYRPDALLEGIAPHAADPAAGIVDFHLYTFNAVDATEKWRQAYLTKLGAAVAAA